MSELVALAVPGVRSGPDDALLRVVFVPRLDGPGATLADHGLADWPAALAGASVQVQVRSAAGAAPATVDLPVRTTADSAVWQAFFGTIEVRSFSPPTPPEVPDPTDTAAQAEAIDSLYARATASVGDPAVIAAGLDALPADQPPPAPDPSAPVADTVRVDFHRALALLREHPAVLRRLGLIVEVDVPRAVLDAAPGGHVRVVWPGRPGRMGMTAPWTAYELDRGRFVPASTALHRAGLVDLNNKKKE